MPPRLRVARTTYEVPIRGGALSSEFRAAPGEPWDDSLRTTDGETSHSAMRENFRYFLEKVIPTAEESGVYLACHPGEEESRWGLNERCVDRVSADDPPLSRLRGLARIMSSPEDLSAALALHPSPHNGLTLCQGCVSEMCGGTGRTVPDVIRGLPLNRVHFVHFRF